MRDEGRKKEASKVKQNKAKQHSTPKAVTFPKKNELPRVGLEPTTLYTLDRALYMYHCATPYIYLCRHPQGQRGISVSPEDRESRLPAYADSVGHAHSQRLRLSAAAVAVGLRGQR